MSSILSDCGGPCQRPRTGAAPQRTRAQGPPWRIWRPIAHRESQPHQVGSELSGNRRGRRATGRGCAERSGVDGAYGENVTRVEHVVEEREERVLVVHPQLPGPIRCRDTESAANATNLRPALRIAASARDPMRALAPQVSRSHRRPEGPPQTEHSSASTQPQGQPVQWRAPAGDDPGPAPRESSRALIQGGSSRPIAAGVTTEPRVRARSSCCHPWSLRSPPSCSPEERQSCNEERGKRHEESALEHVGDGHQPIS